MYCYLSFSDTSLQCKLGLLLDNLNLFLESSIRSFTTKAFVLSSSVDFLLEPCSTCRCTVPHNVMLSVDSPMDKHLPPVFYKGRLSWVHVRTAEAPNFKCRVIQALYLTTVSSSKWLFRFCFGFFCIVYSCFLCFELVVIVRLYLISCLCVLHTNVIHVLWFCG